MLRKATIGFVMSVRLSVCPRGTISIKPIHSNTHNNFATTMCDCYLVCFSRHCHNLLRRLLEEVEGLICQHHHHHLLLHHIFVMELGHLLTRSGLTYPEVSSKVYHDSFCQLDSSVSLPWVIYFEAFYLHVVSSFSCIPVICPKLVLFLTPLQFVICFVICPSVSCCSSHVFHLCCCYSSDVPCFNSPSFAAI